LLLTQEKYATELLAKAGMKDCTTSPTPLSSSEKLSLANGSPVGSNNVTQCRSIVGAFQYLTLTKSVSIYLHAPTTAH
jgi:hypothetical protein